MTPLRRAGLWLYRWGLPLLGAVLVGVAIWALFATTISNANALNDALEGEDTATTRAEHLEGTVAELTGEIGLLRRQVAALSAQVEQLGGQPVVIVEGDQPDEPPPTSTTTTTTTSTTTTTTEPPPQTTTTHGHPCHAPPLLCHPDG